MFLPLTVGGGIRSTDDMRRLLLAGADKARRLATPFIRELRHAVGLRPLALASAARAKAGIARSFQIPRPFVDMSVFENVYVGAAFAGSSHGQAGYEAAARALEAAAGSVALEVRRGGDTQTITLEKTPREKTAEEKTPA